MTKVVGFFVWKLYIKIERKSFLIKLKLLLMKKRIVNILTIAFVLTTFGFIMDGDAKEPNMLMRFVEFSFMFGVLTVLTVLTSIIYFGINFTKRSFQKA